MSFRLIKVAQGNMSRLGKVAFRSSVPLFLSQRNGSEEIGDDDNKKPAVFHSCPGCGRRSSQIMHQLQRTPYTGH